MPATKVDASLKVDAPLSIALPRVRRLIQALGYDPASLAEIVEYVAQHGTAECCPALVAEHATQVEDLLPVDPAWGSSAWDSARWSVGKAVAQ